MLFGVGCSGLPDKLVGAVGGLPDDNLDLPGPSRPCFFLCTGTQYRDGKRRGQQDYSRCKITLCFHFFSPLSFFNNIDGIRQGVVHICRNSEHRTMPCAAPPREGLSPRTMGPLTYAVETYFTV
ncbi:MAG: hypothetical protein LBG05_08525 [Treponema sp.]|nr:hypothetical protein [Treponema sp.]